MRRKLPFDEEILADWLKQSNIWPPPSVRDRILVLIDEACQDLGKLGYKWEQPWGPVEESAGDRFWYFNDYGGVVVEPNEDAERDRLRKEALSRKEASSREKGKTIVIKLVDKLWPLYYWDSAGPDKLPGVVRIMRQLFHCRPFDKFSEEAYECIKEHEQGLFEGRKQDLDGMSEGTIPRRGRTPIAEKDQERRRQNEVVHRQSNGRLSENDKKLYELIGKDQFQARTNDELERSYRRKAETKLGHPYPKQAQGFRSAVKRIRKHRGLPTSQEIRKKRST